MWSSTTRLAGVVPARTGKTTYVPGKGSYTRAKSGKAKSFQGNGPAPSGSVKQPEAAAATAPTVTVTSSGATATNFGSKRAARKAVRAQARSARRVKRIERAVLSEPQRTAKRPAPKVAKYVPPKAAAPPTSKPRMFKGHKTAGAPTLASLRSASQAGTLKVNQKGFAVTPQVRHAVKALKQARRTYAKKAMPQISGLRNKEQERFAETLSKKTKIPPKLAGEWVLQESGASSAGAGGEAGEQNQLGVGYPAHPTSFSESPYFNNTTPEQAAKATAKWMEGKIGGEYGYQAASSIEGIPKLAKSGASEDAIRAYIEGPSGWGTGAIGQSGVTATPGKAAPRVAKRLKRAEQKAQGLGLKVAKSASHVAGPSRIPSVVYIGKQAEKKFGLNVGENPAFGGVAPVHVPDSYHYRTDSKGRGEAIDVSGEPAQMMAFDHWVARKWGQGVTELFYDPGISIKEGAEIGAIGDHEDHVHVAVAMPGERIEGGMATPGGTAPVAGPGGAMFVGYGSTASAAEASATRARKAAAKGKGRRRSPMERFWATSRKLQSLGVSAFTVPKEATKGVTLAALEKKYGKAAV